MFFYGPKPKRFEFAPKRSEEKRLFEASQRKEDVRKPIIIGTHARREIVQAVWGGLLDLKIGAFDFANKLEYLVVLDYLS